jgi:accessory colonization factor AcfC
VEQLDKKFQKLEDVFKKGYKKVLNEGSGNENFSFSNSFGKESSQLNSNSQEEVYRTGITGEFLASQDFEIFRHFSVYQKL